MNRSVLLFAVCSIMPMLTAQPAYAQAITTPSGELRLGMTKDQVTRLLHSEVTEGGDPEGFFQRRTVNAKFDNRQVSGILTTKGIVYSIYSHESFPADPIGRQAAEAAFRSYLKAYAASATAPIFGASEATIRAWASSEGHPMKVILMCDETVLIVEISDYQRQIADDGESDERRQYFKEFGPYSSRRCF